MTPHRSRSDRGTLELKVKYRDLPRIRRASGTNDAELLATYRAMCDAMFESGHHDHLRAIARGSLRLPVVYAAYRKGKLHELPAGNVAGKLRDAWTTWASTLPQGKHRKDIEGTGKRMIEDDDLVADLPKRLRAHRAIMSAAGHAPAFNHARNYCRSFVRDTFGPSDPFYRKVVDVQPLDHEAKPGHPMTVERLAERIAQLGYAHGSALYAMSVTGMGPGEYWGTWEEEGEGDERWVHIYGTKRRQRNRLVPRVGPIPRPMVTESAFKSKLRRLKKDTRPYDGRRTFANLLQLGKIPRNRRKMYLGHGAKDSTDLYERPEIHDWLMDDGKTLAALVAHLAPRALTVVRAG